MVIRLDKEAIIRALQQEIKRQGVDAQLNEERVSFYERENHGYTSIQRVDFVDIYIPDKE